MGSTVCVVYPYERYRCCSAAVLECAVVANFEIANGFWGLHTKRAKCMNRGRGSRNLKKKKRHNTIRIFLVMRNEECNTSTTLLLYSW